MINRLIKGILAIAILVLVAPSQVAFAQPFISITSSGNLSATISVSGASYGQVVDLVYTLPGSTLQTVISNIGIQ